MASEMFRSRTALCTSLGALVGLVALLLDTSVLVDDDVLVGLGGGPSGGASPLRLLPRALIGELAAALALAGTTELGGQVLGGDLGEQLRLVSAAEDVNLVDGDGVEETLDDAESAAEAPGGIDNVQLAQTLGVVVLGDLGSLANVSVDGGDAGDADTLQIHNGAAGLEQLAGLARAGGQTGVGQLLVLADEVLQHALTGGDLVHSVEVDLAELLDVDGAAILGQD